MVALAGVEVPVSDGPWAGHMHLVHVGQQVPPNLVLGMKVIRHPAAFKDVPFRGSHSLTTTVTCDGNLLIGYVLTGVWIGPVFRDATAELLDAMVRDGAIDWQVNDDEEVFP